MRARDLAFLGLCALAACGPSGSNGDGNDGGGTPVCNPGTEEACYDGASGTMGVGTCRGGTRTCNDQGFWSNCEGQVTPTADVCGSGADENCNGQVDEVTDADGDGFTNCDGDCCDASTEGCSAPDLVNPGAFDAPGNSLDDDCDGTPDNTMATCDMGLTSNSNAAIDYAKAMDICRTATEAAGDARWGVVSAQFFKADGTTSPAVNSRGIRPAFGATTPRGGQSMTVLSTGVAAAKSQTMPNYVNFQTGPAMGTTSGFPADWLSLNGDTLPNLEDCPAPGDTDTAYDPIMLELRIRVPTNAKSFSFKVNFLSSEFPEFTCSAYNDFFVVLLDSEFAGSPANPADKNLATYTAGDGTIYPVGVNLAYDNTGLFTACVNGDTGCSVTGVPGTINTCQPAALAEIANSGMDDTSPIAVCGTTGQRLGGGTGWLSTSGNVVGGEIMKLRIAIWDTSDGVLDSVALLDGFQWSVDASDPGTVIVD